jgi:hypothetical protein
MKICFKKLTARRLNGFRTGRGLAGVIAEQTRLATALGLAGCSRSRAQPAFPKNSISLARSSGEARPA